MNLDVGILGCDLSQIVGLNVFAAMAQAIKEVNVALNTSLDDGVHHAQHGGQSDTAADQNNRRISARIEEERSCGRLDVDNIALVEMIVEMAGANSGLAVRFARRRANALDRDPEIIRFRRI